MPSASVETLPGTSSCVKVKVVCAVAEALPNARATATIAKEILRAFMFLLSLQLSIVAGNGPDKFESNVNKKNLNARMGKRDVSQRIEDETRIQYPRPFAGFAKLGF